MNHTKIPGLEPTIGNIIGRVGSFKSRRNCGSSEGIGHIRIPRVFLHEVAYGDLGWSGQCRGGGAAIAVSCDCAVCGLLYLIYQGLGVERVRGPRIKKR